MALETFGLFLPLFTGKPNLNISTGPGHLRKVELAKNNNNNNNPKEDLEWILMYLHVGNLSGLLGLRLFLNII